MRGGISAMLALVALALFPAGAAAASEHAWTQRALALQYSLAGDVPLSNTPWVYTHNSFNSRAEMGPTLSDTDANQQLSITDQLNDGVRHLEIDTHWFGGRAVVCHALDNHVGCSLEKPLATVLGEVRDWLRANPSQVLLLYLESHLDNDTGYAAGAAAIQSSLGDLVLRPPSKGSRCDPLPLSLTRDEIRKRGKRVLLMGPCGDGNAWRGWVFDETRRKTGSDNAAFRPFPGCGPDFTRGQYDAYPIRYYEDSTQLSKTAAGGKTDPITAAIAARMIRCGVDIIGFDQLTTDDPRLEAVVWSWARGQPGAAGNCAVQRPDGRWEARACSERHRAACHTRTGAWRVSGLSGPAPSAPRLCGGSRRTAVPRTGYGGQLLETAQKRAGAGAVWLGYRRTRAGWGRYERRGCGPRLRRPRQRWRVRRGIARFRVRLRFACTHERLRRPLVVKGGRHTVRSRTDVLTKVRVRRRTRRLVVRYRYAGRRHRATVLLRRR
ncbi:MAG TPA: phosphatidylinositol-specific phospholipase C domain-containing protein [Thermoleophilaceae bacterium]